MSVFLSEMECCAVGELDGIEEGTSKDSMLSLGGEFYGHWSRGLRAFIIFTCSSEKKHGNNLSKFIKKNSLGQVIKIKARENPNTGNYVNVWVWSINKRAFKKWYKQNKTNERY